MTEKNVEMARLLMVAEAVVEELDRQGLLEAVINLGFDPTEMAKAVIKAADGDVVPAKRSPPL
jgi:Holliday junction resolvasome RuvABC DNA-binding subunit